MASLSVVQIFDLAIQLQTRVMLKAAEDLYREILQTDPEKPLAEYTHFNLGLILTNSGRVHEAATSYRRALVIEPQFPEALTNLAGLDSGAKRNALRRSGFERPFQARQSRLGMAS